MTKVTGLRTLFSKKCTMKEKYDTYFSVDYPNFAISKHSAFIHTFQNRLEWNLICSNPSETE